MISIDLALKRLKEIADKDFKSLDEALLHFYEEMEYSTTELAKATGQMSPDTVRRYLHKIGADIKGKGGAHNFSKTERRFTRLEWLELSTEVLSTRLGKSKEVIRRMARAYGYPRKQGGR